MTAKKGKKSKHERKLAKRKLMKGLTKCSQSGYKQYKKQS